MKLLVSVRDVDEAVQVAGAGIDFIDLKEPRDGALGAVALPVVRDIVGALRAAAALQGVAPRHAISATIGDQPRDAADAIGWALPRVQALAACGVDLVKVGIAPGAQASALLDALAHAGPRVVPVFIADAGIDAALFTQACVAGFPAVMLDTADKRRGSLFDVLDAATLQRCIAEARAASVEIGVAGALRMQHWPALHALAPDYAGFRTAVCDGDRTGTLDPTRLAALIEAARATPPG